MPCQFTSMIVGAIIASTNAMSDYDIRHEAMLKEPGVLDLAKNVYYEARNESLEAQMAVALVTMNRVESDIFPDTIEEVVYQKYKGICQFSWYCDGKSDTPQEIEAWAKAIAIAYMVKMNYGYVDDITNGADHYHADYVDPEWADYEWIQRVTSIETHIFYRSKPKE